MGNTLVVGIMTQGKRIKIPNRDGYIKIESEEQDILDSQPVQRLRRIRQLGMTNMVYPGATHTRFEHSIGVMDLAGRLADSIGLSDAECRKYRIAGLLHDTGHSPFSHTLERLDGNKTPDHEEISCQKVDKLKGKFPEGVSARGVKQAIRGNDQYNIVAGAVDADRLDYLERDAQNVGLNQGDIDHASILQFAKHGEIQGGESAVVFDEKAIPALNSFFTSRISMLNSAYRHPVANAYERMIEEASYELARDSVYDLEEEDLREMDDYQLHAVLTDHEGRAGELYDRIENRNHYALIADLNCDNVDKSVLTDAIKNKDKRQVEENLNEYISDKNDVLIQFPSIPKSVEERERVYVNVNNDLREFKNISYFRKAVYDEEWRAAQINVYLKNSREEEQITPDIIKRAMEIPA